MISLNKDTYIHTLALRLTLHRDRESLIGCTTTLLDFTNYKRDLV